MNMKRILKMVADNGRLKRLPAEVIVHIGRHRNNYFKFFVLTTIIVVVFSYRSSVRYQYGGGEQIVVGLPTLSSVSPNVVAGQLVFRVQLEESGNSATVKNDALESSTRIIAIGGGMTSRHVAGVSRSNAAAKFVFFNTFLPSFCSTASPTFTYHFYLAFDFDDPVFSSSELSIGFQRTFAAETMQLCYRPRGVRTSLHLVQCNHSGRPAWAQNDAMMEAYLDNADYYYRINDDTRLITGNWTEAFVDVIDHYNPPRVGVVGPNHQGGNQAILTYDFVHRTHIDLFGFYYPRMFGDWSADWWISEVYQPNRSTKLSDVLLDHTMYLGQRYENRALGSRLSPVDRFTLDRVTVQRYVAAVQLNNQSGLLSTKSDGKRVIAMSLYGRNPRHLWGAIRNAQLVPVHFPGWKLRVYVPSTALESAMEELAVPPQFIYKLQLLGADVARVTIDKSSASTFLSPRDWRLLVAENLTIEYFLIRDADARLTDRDAAAVTDWINQVEVAKDFGDRNAFPVHCMFDHPNHTDRSIIDGLWGGRPRAIRHLLRKSLARALYWKATCTANSCNELSDANRQQRWERAFDDVIGSFVRDGLAYCHCNITSPCRNDDMMSACASRSNRQFPVARVLDEFVGAMFDEHQQPVSVDGPVECTTTSASTTTTTPASTTTTTSPSTTTTTSPSTTTTTSPSTTTTTSPSTTTTRHAISGA